MNPIKKKIHINMHKIRANKKHGTNEPVIAIKTYKDNTYCHGVEILGSSTVVYSPDKPLSCGARVWIETDAELKLTIGGSLDKKTAQSSPQK